MKCTDYVIRNGYDGKKCLVHARCCDSPFGMIATAQYLDVTGNDLFSGLYMSKSRDRGKTWSEFVLQKSLEESKVGNRIRVGCDATPLYHKKTGKVILIGHTADYEPDCKHPIDAERFTFYSVYDQEKDEFTEMDFIQMPLGFRDCGNGSGQSIELENGDLLIPVYWKKYGSNEYCSKVIRCSFDGCKLSLVGLGDDVLFPVKRGAYEPSIVFYEGFYYMTMRNDECGLIAKSKDGLYYSDLSLWQWDDGSLLDNYNTQQHWMKVKDELYLVYTRRHANNNHVFRHRAPLFAARVENMRLIRDSEFEIISQRGARHGNFGVCSRDDGTALVMAAEWMQPCGCEQYGSDNSVFLSVIEKE